MRWLPSLLLGCGAMESPLSIVDDLRIVALIQDPSAPVAGEDFTIEAEVFDGANAGFETWTWWCVEDTCGEGPMPPVASFEDPRFTQYGFACAPAGCEGPGDLAEPESWLVDRPFETTSLASTTAFQSPNPDLRLNFNPILSIATDDFLVVDPGSTLVLTASMSDATFEDARVAGYARTGTFPQPDWRIETEVEVQWIAPEEPGMVELVWVVNDGFAGMDVVRLEVEVR